MVIATHLIKVKGTFDDKKWTDEKLRNFVEYKIKDEINSVYHPDLELFQIKDNNIEIWTYVSSVLLKPLDKTIRDWLDNHIREEGLTVESINIEKSGNGFYVNIP
jgi:hypothetical protein